jgi:hypothetical protein
MKTKEILLNIPTNIEYDYEDININEIKNLKKNLFRMFCLSLIIFISIILINKLIYN